MTEHIINASITITGWSGAAQQLRGCEIVLLPGREGPLLLGRPQLGQLEILPLRVQIETAVNRHDQRRRARSGQRSQQKKAAAMALREITTYSHEHNPPDRSDKWGAKMSDQDVDDIAAPNF